MQEFSIHRRKVIGTMLLLPALRLHALTHTPEGSHARLAEIEQRLGGQLGVAVVDGDGRPHLAYRSAQRFPMCSTFKFLLVAAVLARADAKTMDLTRFMPFSTADLLDYAPISRQRLKDGGMTLSELCAASIQYSDNTAANLILQALGGPAAVTTYARTIGDRVTRLDRNEPSLNQALEGDERDTTTPTAMVQDMRAILLGNALSQSSREQLQAWLIGNTTGAARLRAGLPPTWKVGDKTGSGERGALNDIAITWPVDQPTHARPPLLIAAYFVGSRASSEERSAALAEVGRIVAARF